jgi:hypothetical protein
LKEIEEILRIALVGRLGTSVNEGPYVVPLCFLYHQGRIYFHSALIGMKLENIKKNANVCFEVDIESKPVKATKPCDFDMHYRSVIAFGKARIIERTQKKLEIMKRIIAKYDPERRASPLTEEMIREKKVAVVEITIEKISGKKKLKLQTM